MMSDKLDFAGRQRASELLDWIVDCPEEAAHRLAALEAENAALRMFVHWVHKDECASLLAGSKECDCGLAALLAAEEEDDE